MKKFSLFAIATMMLFSVKAQTLNDLKNKATTIVGGGTSSLTNDEVVNGLKEALSIGSNNAAGLASKLDGFNKNAKIRIPFPKEAQAVKNTAINLGLKSQVDKFELTLNRAAEEACKNAAPIFKDAVRSMTIADGFKILKGADNAATVYLNEKTNAELYKKFLPVVKAAIQKVQLTKYWNPLITTYNKVPGVQKQNPNLDDYVTKKAMDGLFKLIAEEELKIRKDPVARVSDLLKKVFGNKG